ncbi:MAG: hypothetical protein P8Y68_19370, partial [Anaerolineales bacterium]
ELRETFLAQPEVQAVLTACNFCKPLVFRQFTQHGYIGNAARFAFETLSSLYSKRENCFD